MNNSLKRGGIKPNFWGQSRINLAQDFKDIIYSQYNSKETLYIYCDCSMDGEGNGMAIACSYVQRGFVTVSSNIIHSPNDCRGKNIYGELASILLGLSEFENHIDRFNTTVVIYSDVDHINHIFNSKVSFKKVRSLKKQQKRLIQLLNLKRIENPTLTISIEYLPKNFKYYNPFAKSAHNAARKLLTSRTDRLGFLLKKY